MQPYFFPYIGYFQLIDAVDKYILYDNLSYIKEGWVHRNRILVNGKPAYIMAQVQEKSSNKKISKTFLTEDTRWKYKILKTLFLNYKVANHFEEIYPLIENIILSHEHTIGDYNANSIKKICLFLEITTEITTEIDKFNNLEDLLQKDNYTDDFSYLHLQSPTQKVIRVLEICRKENASVFINAIGGQSLYHKEEFKKNNIDLYFINTLVHTYHQVRTSHFIPNLSIIDVLMNCGKKKTKELLTQYTLI